MHVPPASSEVAVASTGPLPAPHRAATAMTFSNAGTTPPAADADLVAAPTPAARWCRELAGDLAGSRGTVRVRLGPGVLRNLEIARSVAGFPVPDERVGDVERALGEDGWFGPNGIERFLAALRRLGVRNGRGTGSDVDVHVAAGFLPFSLPGAVAPRGWPPAPEIVGYLSAAGLEFTADGSSGPKDAAVSGELAAALGPLADRRTFFIGAPRTKAFARAIGVAPDSHFVIPDRAAYGLTDDVLEAARRFLALPGSDPPVILHAASLVGNTVLLELAAGKTAFVGIDLGLAATILDDEYLATRGWFIQHGAGIIRTRDALVGAPVGGETAETRHARAVRFGRGWRSATRRWRSEPRAALAELESTLVASEGLNLPIARAIALLWRWVLGEPLPDGWPQALLDEPSKHEPAAIAAIMLQAAGRTAEADLALQQAARLCPPDELVRELQSRLRAGHPPPLSTPAIDGVFTLSERPYHGSGFCWSLSGDLPRRWPDA
jgi:hypothetical protein